MTETTTSPTTRHRRAWPWMLGIFLAGAVLNAITIELLPARGDRGIYILGALPVLLAMAIACALIRSGVKKTLFMIVPALLLLAGIEGMFRIYYHVYAPPRMRAYLSTPAAGDVSAGGIYSPHHYALYTLTPNVHYPDGLQHNGLGLRDHRDLAPDPDAVRIVFIGGSTTYTVGVRDNAKIFTRGLEEKLNAYYKTPLGEKHIEVINAGAGGSTSAENLMRLIFFVSELKPDLIVIQHGLNDVWARGCGEIASDFSNYRKRWSPPPVFDPRFSIAYGLSRRACEHSFFLNFAAIRLGLYKPYLLKDYTTRARRESPDADSLQTNGTGYFERNTRYMIAVAREMGAEVMLATVPVTTRVKKIREQAVPEHNALLERIAQETGCLFYDFAAEMPKDDQHLPDGRHVNQLGSDTKRNLYFNHFVKTGVIERMTGGK